MGVHNCNHIHRRLFSLIDRKEKERLKELFREVCIADNAWKNSVIMHNDAYTQRKIALLAVAEILDISIEFFQIEDEIREQKWRLKDGVNDKYVLVGRSGNG